mgnify:CR=1 FL=1
MPNIDNIKKYKNIIIKYLFYKNHVDTYICIEVKK